MSMSRTVIQVERISKAYRIGAKEEKSDTLAGAIKSVLMTPFRNFKDIKNLKSFNRQEETIFWALRDINFEVKEGEVLGIIGHNGAGKSTLLKILSRITEPTEGRITIHGRVSSLLEVGTGFHPDLTGRENIYMNGTILGMTKREIDRKIDEIIDFSGVSQHIDTPVKRYSSGMTVRLAFSVAAHLDPEILIIDEVLAVGDLEFQRKCLGKMQSVAQAGRTVLFVSHNMTAVSGLCSRGLLLSKGAITKDATPESVVSDYVTGTAKGVVSSQWTPPYVTDKKIRFGEIRLLSVGSVIKMGEDFGFLFVIHSKIRQTGFQVCVKIFDSSFNLLTTLYNTDFGIEFEVKPGKNEFKLNIGGNNLLPGKYYFSFSAMYNYGSEIFEELDKVVALDLLAGNVNDSGIALGSDRGLIWFKLT